MSDSSPSPRDAHASGSHYQPSLSIVLALVVLFVGATFLMVRASPKSLPPSPTTAPSLAAGATTTTTTTLTFVRSKIRVQVANGTTITGLAAKFTHLLMTQNWDTLPPGNGPRVSATVVYYNPGSHRAALDIASAIKVSVAAVQPLNGQNPIAGSSGDDVIVVLGPNSGLG